MSLGPASAGGVGAKGPSAPTHRPTWLLVLSSITLVYGGLTLVNGLTALRNPVSAARFSVARPMAPEEEAMAQQMAAVTTAIVSRHLGAIRANAAASVLFALLMLYSAAAALSRDKHGRRANLIAAWVGILYQLGTLPLAIPIANDFATTGAPILIRMVEARRAAADAGIAGDAGTSPAADAGAKTEANPQSKPAGDASATATTDPAADGPPRPEVLAGFTQTVFLSIPIATALLGIMGSLLLLGFFGGRRGRALYGLPPRR
jgi:hypothetical protein